MFGMSSSSIVKAITADLEFEPKGLLVLFPSSTVNPSDGHVYKKEMSSKHQRMGLDEMMKSRDRPLVFRRPMI